MALKKQSRSHRVPQVDAPLLPPFVYPSKDQAQQSRIAKWVAAGCLRRIGPRLYSSLPQGEVEVALRKSWSEVVSHLFPDAVLSYCSALEYRPNSKGEIFLTGATNRRVQYPGLMLVFIRGPKALQDDLVFLGMRASSFPRALLENLSTQQRTSNRSIPRAQIEQRLERVLQNRGESELSLIRDRAREIAEKFRWGAEFKKLEALIGALLGTRPSQALTSREAKARSVGRPFDSGSIEKFDGLLSELLQEQQAGVKDPVKSSQHFKNKAFFEAYFSNYIEGTTFELEEAEEIVFEKKIPKDRPQDGHDISGTFEIVSDLQEMKQTPESFDHLLFMLRSRHEILMRARPENLPGQFKLKPNRAGNSHFTPPELVQGTLEKGFDRYLSLPLGLSRAIFMMFLVSEVHPFVDGNGRIARIMMNAEMVSQGLATIIIPTVFREEYLLSLRALSRMDRPKSLVKSLTYAQKLSALDFSKYSKILKYLQDHFWFQEPDEAKWLGSMK